MNTKKVISLIITAILIGCFVSLPFYFISHFKTNEESMRTNQIDTNQIDWEEIYPFIDIKTENNDTSGIKSGISFYKYLSTKISSGFENNVPYQLFFRRFFIEQYGRLNKILGMRIVRDANDITISTHNQYLIERQDNKRDIPETVNRISKLSAEIKRLNMDFVYVILPFKKLSNADIISGVIDNYHSYNQDKMRQGLERKNVDVLDLRERMPANYDEYMSMFYKTDHHWKNQTGLWATELIAEKLNLDFDSGFDLSWFEPEKYEVIKYPNLVLGSYGKKVSKGYIANEDFELVIPKYENELHAIIPEMNFDKIGNFMILIDTRQLAYGDEYNLNPYGALAYGNQALIKIENKYAANKSKILIIKDSFANAITPYLALQCAQLDIIDLRDFTGSLVSYLEQNKYDTVMVMSSGCGVSIGKDPEDHTSLWNFE